MPYQTVSVPPELFFTHDGVHVYHTYKDDEIGQGCRMFWYTLHPRSDGDEAEHFDVRSLGTAQLMDYEGHKRLIAAALDDGRLEAPAPEDNKPWSHTVLVEVLGLEPDGDAAEIVSKALTIAADTTNKLGLLPAEIGTVAFDVTVL